MKQLNPVRFFEDSTSSNNYHITVDHIDDDYVISTKIYNPDIIEFLNWFLGQFSSFYNTVMDKQAISSMAYSRSISNNDIKYLHATVLYIKSDNELCFTTTSDKAWKPSILNQFDSSRKNNIKNKLAHIIQVIFGLKDEDDSQTIKQFLDKGKYSNLNYSVLNNFQNSCLDRLTLKDLKILCNILSNKKVKEDNHYQELVGYPTDPIISEYLESLKQNILDKLYESNKKLDEVNEEITMKYVALQREYADDLSYNMRTNSFNHTRDNQYRQDEFRDKKAKLVDLKSKKRLAIINEFNALIDKTKEELRTSFPVHALMLNSKTGYFNFMTI